jgi:transcription antitermination factor NusG
MTSYESNLLETSSTFGALLVDEPRWYAVQTRARHEKRIGTELEQKGITAFVPTMRETHRWSDRTKVVEVSVFSCYIFVKVVAASAQRLEVLKTMGVFRFVSVNGAPAPIPDGEIEGVRRVLANNLPVSACGFVQIGQRVRIRGGSLDGLEGIIENIRGGNKLVLSVELIHQSVAVTIDGYSVEPVDPSFELRSSAFPNTQNKTATAVGS